MIDRYPLPGPVVGSRIDVLLIVAAICLFIAVYGSWKWFSTGISKPAPIDRRDLYKYDKLP